MPNIINNLFSRLDQENTLGGKVRVTFKKSDVHFFSKPDSRQCVIDLHLKRTEETNPNLVLVNQYLNKRLEPSSNLCDAKLRFDKLELANQLLELLRQPNNENFLTQLIALYDKSVQLDGDQTKLGSSYREISYAVPMRELGDVFIKVRSTHDAAFKKAYEKYYDKLCELGEALCYAPHPCVN